MSSNHNFECNSPWSQKKKQLDFFPNPIRKQTSCQFETPKKRDNLVDRLTPRKISSSFYNLLMSEENQNSNSQQKSPRNQQFSDMQDNSNNNNNNNNLNDSLIEENSSHKYKRMLKYNILGSINDFNNKDMFQQGYTPIKLNRNESSNSQQSSSLYGSSSKKNSNMNFSVLKYKQNSGCRRNSEMMLNYNLSSNPLKIQQSIVNNTESNQIRKIAKHPYKILDAPGLKDDFYYNLLDWSSNNIIGIALENSIYTWSAKTTEAVKLAEFQNSTVTSLNWHPQGILLASGDDKGQIKIYDTEKNIIINKYQNHSKRIGSLCWNGNIITSGSRDSKIILSDIRTPKPYEMKFIGHKQEVCGAKWSYDQNILASGGNDNMVLTWSLKMGKNLSKFTEHKAAVKALTWSPHSHSTLITGGGTTDKTLKFWNVNTQKLVHSIDTGSQICNMAFTKNSNEFVTTHGYSMNQLAIWKINTTSQPCLDDDYSSYYESQSSNTIKDVQRIATLYGHTYRVLYLAVSPDGENIVTGSGDETLRFWKVFPSAERTQHYNKSSLDNFKMEIR